MPTHDMGSMSPSEYAKACGLKSLQQVATMSGFHLNTLLNWYTERPDAFRLLVTGCAAEYMPEYSPPEKQTFTLRCPHCRRGIDAHFTQVPKE